jgi:hypothetical protein
VKKYAVTIPFAGHLFLEVEANDERDAIERAMNEVSSDHIESWEALDSFNAGNVCHCPSPWEAIAELVDDDDGSSSR